MTVTTHHDVLVANVDLAGRDVLDVGCGRGELSRFMRSQGARVTSIECDDQTRAEAIAADPDHADSYVDAVGEDLPFADRSFDVVVYSYSLHHVPVDAIPVAFDEARRVLRPGGTMYVVEPSTDDDVDELGLRINDELAVRRAAQAALDAVSGFDIRTRFEYLTEARHAGFDAWAAGLVGHDDRRAAALEADRDRLRADFERLAERRGDGWVLTRRNLAAVLTPNGQSTSSAW